MSPISETAYAKINLALHVRRRRDDGYHDLETLFGFAEDGDHLSGELADDISLAIAGPFGEGLSESDNLVVQAAEALQTHFGVEQGAALVLDKQLPVASGIGGGSAVGRYCAVVEPVMGYRCKRRGACSIARPAWR